MDDVTSIQVADLKMPSVGLGLWKIETERTAAMVREAIKLGYRHLDAACDYGNEEQAGEGIREAIQAGLCSREDLWVTSKLWNTYHQPEHVALALEKSLGDLGLDYLDLYLVHFPISLKYVAIDDRYPPGWIFDPEAEKPKMEPTSVPLAETWGAMEELKRQGKVKQIGVCNFGISLLRDLLSYCEEKPSVLQVESHPYLVQEKLLRFCRENEIAYTAFSPLGAGSYVELGMASQGESVLQNQEIAGIAARYGKTAAQVVLRWGVQRGTSVIPKTSRVERLEENIGLFDFSLTEEEMQTIAALDQHKRFNDPGEFCEKAFGCFFPIYE